MPVCSGVFTFKADATFCFVAVNRGTVMLKISDLIFGLARDSCWENNHSVHTNYVYIQTVEETIWTSIP